MPTIDQLTPATAASDTDEMMASQSGIARKVTRAQVVAGLQPALSIPSGTVLGRQSVGVGAPETLAIGTNLVLNGGTLSATTGYVVSTLSSGTVPAAGDLVAMGQNGANTAVPYQRFMSGLAGVSGIDASQLLVTATGASTSQKLADLAASTLQTTGGQMTGSLTLAANPVSPLQAATMQYVNEEFALALPKAGGTMTGPLILAADPTAPLQSATKEYVDARVATALPVSGGTMTGLLALSADPVAATQAATKHYVDSQISTAVPVIGGTMTGPLTLAADPTTSLQAATKHYVDTSGASALPLSGGTLTGPLTLTSDPTSSLQAATKHYVDTSAAAGVPVTGASMTGPLLLSGNPSVALQAAPKQYVDSQTATSLPITGGTMSGALMLAADPTTPLQAATKEYVDAQATAALARAGGTMTGALTLAADPTAALQAATKEYVDTQVGTALPKSGGTLTGALATTSGGNSTATSDGNPTLDFMQGRINFQRKTMTGNPGNPGVFIAYDNYSSGYTPLADGIYTGAPAFQINATSHAGSNGTMVGELINLSSQGNNPFASEDQGLGVLVTKLGQNSTWAISTQTVDETGLPPGSFASVGLEIDLVANGVDDQTSLYNPTAGNRSFILLVGKANPAPAFATNTAYSVGQVVSATSSAGTPSVYVVTVAGTSGSTAPTFPTSGLVASGTATFEYGTGFLPSFGHGIFIGHDTNYSISYSSGFATNASYDNAVIDISQASLTNSNGAGIRLAHNMPIDFSANGTSAQQNNRILVYSNYLAGLAYIVNGTEAMAIGDNFRFATAGVSTFGYSSSANLAGITTGYSAGGLTVGYNASGVAGETDFLVGANGLSIYPITSAGHISTPVMTLSGAGNISVTGTVTLPALHTSASYANDTAAAAGGVAVGQLYRNGSVVQVRVS